MSEPHDWLYVSYVAFTGLMALVGIGTLWAVWRQGIFMKKQLAAFIEGQRPQIAADPHGNPAEDFCDPCGPRVQLEIHNTGASTAYDCIYESWIEIIVPPFTDFSSRADHYISENKFSLHSRHKPMVINVPLRKGITQQHTLFSSHDSPFARR